MWSRLSGVRQANCVAQVRFTHVPTSPILRLRKVRKLIAKLPSGLQAVLARAQTRPPPLRCGSRALLHTAARSRAGWGVSVTVTGAEGTPRCPSQSMTAGLGSGGESPLPRSPATSDPESEPAHVRADRARCGRARLRPGIRRALLSPAATARPPT